MKPLRRNSLVPPLAFPGAVLVFSLCLVLAGAILVGCNDSTSPGDVSACNAAPESVALVPAHTSEAATWIAREMAFHHNDERESTDWSCNVAVDDS